TFAILVHEAEIELRLDVAAHGCLPVPLRGSGGVARDAVAFVVERGEGELGIGVAALSRFRNKLHPLSTVLRHAITVEEEDPEGELRRRHTGVGRLAPDPDGRG